MKIIYLLSHDVYLNDGITKKVKSQTDIWKKLGHEVRVFNILVKKNIKTGETPLEVDIFHRKNIVSGPRRLFSTIDKLKPDIIYFRYEPYKPFFIKIFKSYPAIFELNTDDLAETQIVGKQNFKNKIRYYYNKLTRGFILKKAAGFIGVTEEILNIKHYYKFNKPSLFVPNSINLDEFSIKKTKHQNQIPQIVFMGTPGLSWHGIDKILKLSKLTIGVLEFHIVGYDKPISGKYDNVTFYGYLAKQDYEKIIERCDIGISSTALHRINVKGASPLKVREYLAYGLPVIIPYNDSMLTGSYIPDWILKIPNSERNIDVNVDKIIDFSSKLKDYIVSHQEVENYIDANIIEIKRLNFFKEIRSCLK